MLWQPEWDSRLKSPDRTRELLASLADEASVTFDLLFYAAFADKLLGVMLKADTSAEGSGIVATRMQQTYTEAVEKVQDAVARAGVLGFRDAARYTVLTPMAMSSLLELIQDLAIVKQSFRE